MKDINHKRVEELKGQLLSYHPLLVRLGIGSIRTKYWRSTEGLIVGESECTPIRSKDDVPTQVTEICRQLTLEMVGSPNDGDYLKGIEVNAKGELDVFIKTDSMVLSQNDEIGEGKRLLRNQTIRKKRRKRD